MIEGIVGDMVGSVYEAYQWKNKDLSLFQPLPLDSSPDSSLRFLFKENTKWVRQKYSWTDDTLCTLALYSAYINNTDPTETMVYFCKKYINESIGFGKSFTQWLDNPAPYHSYANGSIMRIGFIPHLNLSLNEKITLGFNYTAISHNHPDSFQAVNDFIVLSHLLQSEKENNDFSKQSIRNILLKYDYNKTVENLHEEAKFELNALQTFLQSCVIVLESNCFEDVLRNSFYVGGDSDTLACISSNLASHLYECPQDLIVLAQDTLVPYRDLSLLVEHFNHHYNKHSTVKNLSKKL